MHIEPRLKYIIHLIFLLSQNRSPRFYATFLALALLLLYIGSYQYRIDHPSVYNRPTSPSASSEAFLEEWLGIDLIYPFDPSPVTQYCHRTTFWDPNPVFQLVGGASGNVMEMRQEILDFLFFAMEAGASVMLPEIAPQGQLDGVATASPTLGKLFDEQALIERMGEACLQMAIYMPQVGHAMAEALEGTYQPRSGRMDVSEWNTAELYRKDLWTWLRQKKRYKKGELALVNVEGVKGEVDTRSLPLEIRRRFGGLVRMAPALREMAGRVVQALARRHPGLEIGPSTAASTKGFCGAEMSRIEGGGMEIARDATYDNLTAQAKVFVDYALKGKLEVMYVAAKNDEDVDVVKALAAHHAPHLLVVLKLDLLSQQDSGAVTQLMAAQQELIDIELLRRASIFSGHLLGSASLTVALARDEWQVDRGRINDPWFVQHSEIGVVFDDGISRLLGRDEAKERTRPRGYWP